MVCTTTGIMRTIILTVTIITVITMAREEAQVEAGAQALNQLLLIA
jgi:hypothetical protein